jgi:hypothetical protein
MSELTSHPYFSSKNSRLIFIRKTGNWGAFAQRESEASKAALAKEDSYNRKAASFTSYEQRGGEAEWAEAGKTTEHWTELTQCV